MKAVLLAGGLGYGISEESVSRPKPMIEIGGKPILWHIMRTYSAYGVNGFVICCGYKAYVIREYFVNYFLHTWHGVGGFDLGRHVFSSSWCVASDIARFALWQGQLALIPLWAFWPRRRARSASCHHDGTSMAAADKRDY